MAFAGAGAVTGALVVAWLGKFKHMGRTLLIAAGRLRRAHRALRDDAHLLDQRASCSSAPARAW